MNECEFQNEHKKVEILQLIDLFIFKESMENLFLTTELQLVYLLYIIL